MDKSANSTHVANLYGEHAIPDGVMNPVTMHGVQHAAIHRGTKHHRPGQIG